MPAEDYPRSSPKSPSSSPDKGHTSRRAYQSSSPFSCYAQQDLSPSSQILETSSPSSQTDAEAVMSLSSSPVPYFTMTETHRMAKTNSFSREVLDPGERFDTDVYVPLFVRGILSNPGTLAYVCNTSNNGLGLARMMTPAVLTMVDGVSLGQGSDEQREARRGFVLLGRARKNRGALAQWYGPRYRRINVEMEIVLRDGTELGIDGYAWINGQEDFGCEYILTPMPRSKGGLEQGGVAEGGDDEAAMKVHWHVEL